MTRITNAVRDAIRDALLLHKFGEELLLTRKNYAALAEVIYNDAFAEVERKRMNELPKGWLEERDVIKFSSGVYESHHIYFSGKHAQGLETRYLPETTPNIYRRFPHSCGQLRFDARNILAIRFSDLTQERQKLEERFGKARVQIIAAINAATTLEKLIKVWPEIEPFASKYLEPVTPGGKIQLPAVNTSALNDMLGLPVT